MDEDKAIGEGENKDSSTAAVAAANSPLPLGMKRRSVGEFGMGSLDFTAMILRRDCSTFLREKPLLSPEWSGDHILGGGWLRILLYSLTSYIEYFQAGLVF